MANRYFPNTMPDYSLSLEGSEADYSVMDPDTLLEVAMSIKDEVNRSSSYNFVPFLIALVYNSP